MQIFNPDSKFSQFIYSVMDYVKRALRAIDEDSTLWKLVTALYRYHQAADTYFGR